MHHTGFKLFHLLRKKHPAESGGVYKYPEIRTN